ncbi:FhaA domain-containing protein [Microbacterium sp. 179-B 1A2 NHS]|uniref:FhaA domain-containing protein n=1 Tax=Microbacterium sp. 179-B 1A2 NHS TaxID=3142383 RepID=UPI0039A05805
MGLLDSFEKGIERAVNGAFAKTFRSGVQPVEIASALRSELDAKAAVVSRDRILVPNTLVVRLAPADHERMSALGRTLHDELRQLVENHARSQNYSFAGPVSLAITADEKLSTGTVRVDSRSATAAEVSWQGVVEIDGTQHPLTKSRTVIGRGSDADITIPDAGTSRRHVEIIWDGRRAMVRDMGSTNGTQLNGQKVSEAALEPDSVVTIGRTRITFRVVAQAPRTPPRPGDDDATRMFDLGGSA